MVKNNCCWPLTRMFPNKVAHSGRAKSEKPHPSIIGMEPFLTLTGCSNFKCGLALLPVFVKMAATEHSLLHMSAAAVMVCRKDAGGKKSEQHLNRPQPKPSLAQSAVWCVHQQILQPPTSVQELTINLPRNPCL